MTVPGPVVFFVYSFLSKLVYGKIQTGNLAGSVVLVVYTLAGRLVDGARSVQQRFLSGSLVTGLDRGINLLYRSLNTGTDCLVSLGSGPADKYPFLCRFDICQVPVPPDCIVENYSSISASAGHGQSVQTQQAL